MSELKNIRRPGPALTKLVEAIGILLGAELKQKSYYKVPVPSNYDNTLDLLAHDYQGVLNKLINMQSIGITDQRASELYEKSLEPGFSYDEAIIEGGARCRELFDIIIYLLNQIQKDVNRHPVLANNVFVLMDAQRSSYLSLDVAAHIFSHGLCTVAIISPVDDKITDNGLESALNNTNGHNNHDALNRYLTVDIARRFKSHYKFLDHRFNIEILESQRSNLLNKIKEAAYFANTKILVMGIHENCIYDRMQQSLIHWLAVESEIFGIFVKNQSLPRSFEVVITPKVHMVCLQIDVNVVDSLGKALTCMRSCDSFIVLIVVDDPTPKGDIQDTRFSIGKRSGWVSRSSGTANENVSGATNKIVLEVQEFLSNCQMMGKLRVETKNRLHSFSQEICKYAVQESVDTIILNKHYGKDIILQTIHSANCTVAVVK